MGRVKKPVAAVAPTEIREPITQWNPALRTGVGQSIAARLRTSTERAHAIASKLAPDGPGPGRRLGVYVDSLTYPRKEIPYQRAFTGLSGLLAALEAGDPGALELGIVILGRLDPESTVDIAEQLLQERPWRMLGKALGEVLGAASSERSFVLLLEHPEVPYLRNGLAQHRYPGGVALAWAAYAGHGDIGDADVDPHDRVNAEPVLAYLLRFDAARAFDEVVRLAACNLNFAAHRLLDLATKDSLAVLIGQLDATPLGAALGRSANMGIRALLVADASRAIEGLGGIELLSSAGGRPRLAGLLHWLAFDTFATAGRPASSGWFARDPGFAELCVALRSDPDRDLARLACELLATLPSTVIVGAPPRATTKKVPSAPDAALVAEMQAHREALERLVRYLKKHGYRFCDPKGALKKPSAAGRRAIAKLEKALGPLPPALTACWTVIGSVDLSGQDPSWPHPACLALPDVRERGTVWITDPLMIAPPEAIVADALDGLLDDAPVALAIAPDAIGKAGYSGGALRIWLPCDADDPPIDGGASKETLREHLSRSLRWAGMPGFESIADREWLARVRAAIE